jgi:hypothetical protein
VFDVLSLVGFALQSFDKPAFPHDLSKHPVTARQLHAS